MIEIAIAAFFSFVYKTALHLGRFERAVYKAHQFRQEPLKAEAYLRRALRFPSWGKQKEGRYLCLALLNLLADKRGQSWQEDPEFDRLELISPVAGFYRFAKVKVQAKSGPLVEEARANLAVEIEEHFCSLQAHSLGASMSFALMIAEEYHLAALSFERALEKEPSLDFHFYRCICQSKGNFSDEEVLASHLRAIRYVQEPEQKVTLLCQTAQTLINTGEKEEAQSYLEQAQALASKTPVDAELRSTVNKMALRLAEQTASSNAGLS